VKEKQIKIELMSKLFKVFNADKTKNRKVTCFALLEPKINRYIENIDAAVIDLNNIDIFFRYNWLVKHNPEIN